MRPLIGFKVNDPEYGDPETVTPEEVVTALTEYAHHEWSGRVELALIQTEEELAAFQAGHLVLYRKPVRRVNRKDLSYRKADGSVVKAEQTELFGD